MLTWENEQFNFADISGQYPQYSLGEILLVGPSSQEDRSQRTRDLKDNNKTEVKVGYIFPLSRGVRNLLI
jgi:hypothetical protein